MEDILDSEDKLEPKIIGKEHIPLVVVGVINLVSLYFEYFFYSNLISLSIVSVSFVLVFLRNVYWKYILIVGLILSVFNVVLFSHITFNFYFGFIRVNVIPLILLIWHINSNEKQIKRDLNKLNNAHKSDKGILGSKVSDFESKFQYKSEKQLKDIIDSPSMVPEAVVAAKKLLQDDKCQL